MTSAAAESLDSVNSMQSAKLDREGKLKRANGAVIHRPSGDAEREAPTIPKGCHLTTTESEAILAAASALAALETEQATLYQSATRYRLEGGYTAAKAAEARIEQIKEQHPVARGRVRALMLAGLEAAGQRAAKDYHVAANEVAHAAARLEGVATLRDELLHTNSFDPLTVWATANGVLAPPPQYRPFARGGITPDAWGRDCYWTPSSIVHRESVRRVQSIARTELSSALAGASWPF